MIRVHYDSEGKILGYYPSDIHYEVIPEPYIIISPEEYEQIIGNESCYRVENSKLINIEDTEEYRTELFNKKFSEAMDAVTLGANNSKNYGVLKVGSAYINACWLDYYTTLKKVISKEPRELLLKSYIIEDEKYYITYISLSKKKTAEFINNAIATIQEHQDTKIPAMLFNYISELQAIKESQSLEDLEEFISKIDYGTVLNENEVVLQTRI